MNLLLLGAEDLEGSRRAVVSGRRLAHIREVHRARVGDTLRVGVIDGEVGEARIVALDGERAELDLSLGQAPPPALDLTLYLALPRPPSLRRVLQQGAAMGVKRFVLIHCARTERSYWSSRRLAPAAIREDLLLGLEQARDTVVPAVDRRERFSQALKDMSYKSCNILVADPGAPSPCPRGPPGTLALVVGPEGGLVPPEIDALAAIGARAITLGPRILRVETAVVALLARLGP